MADRRSRKRDWHEAVLKSWSRSDPPYSSTFWLRQLVGCCTTFQSAGLALVGEYGHGGNGLFAVLRNSELSGPMSVVIELTVHWRS